MVELKPKFLTVGVSHSKKERNKPDNSTVKVKHESNLPAIAAGVLLT